jgi:hypothetical protein
MKNKLKIWTILAIGIILLPTCKKDPDLRIPDLQTGIIPLVVKDNTKDVNLDFLNLTDFSATVSVGLYYKDKPKSMNLMVTMNDDLNNTALVKADISSFPTKIDITAADLVDLLPGLDSINQLQLGDYFKFYVDVTLADGSNVYGNDTLYDAYNSSIVNLPGASVEVIYTVVCPFEAAKAIGDYDVVSLDWNASGPVTITADPEDPYTVYVDGLIENVDLLTTGNGESLTLHIDPATSAVTGDPTVLADDLSDWGLPGYTNYGYAPTSGTYYTCDGTYVIKFDLFVDQGSFGEFTFTFTRK